MYTNTKCSSVRRDGFGKIKTTFSGRKKVSAFFCEKKRSSLRFGDGDDDDQVSPFAVNAELGPI
jgi:hypothetical protein